MGRFILNTLNTKLRQREGLWKILINIGWLFIDKIFRVGLNFLINVWIARYLGVELFGLWNYSIAFVALFSILSTLGLDSIVVKALKNEFARKDNILGSAFILKLTGGVLALLLAAVTISIIRPGDVVLNFLVILTASNFIFQSFDVIDLYFQSQMQSKFTVYARTGSFLIVAFLKIFLLLNQYSVTAFALAALVETALGALLLVFVFIINKQHIKAWRIDYSLLSKLVTDGLPLMFAGMVILIYMRIDQIMLGNMVGDEAVGIYSAAVRLSEAWYFIPLIITNSTFPAIIDAKKIDQESYMNKLQKLYDTVAWLGISVAIVISLLADHIILMLYGTSYQDAGIILALHTWTSVFVFLGFACGNWFVIENLQKYAFYRTALGAFINVILNIILIPKYEGVGAALATLVSQFVASYLSNAISSKTFIVFKMQSISLIRVLLLRDVLKFFINKHKSL